MWLTATIGGLGLFLLMSRPTRETESSPFWGGQRLEGSPDSFAAAATHLPTRQVGGEAQMARWLRPSVQAARHAESDRHRRLADD
jgi:hypothetical protein